MSDGVRDRVRGCLVGVALGDALGMPWETCTHQEIAEATSGRGVMGLEQLPDGHARRLGDPRGIALGETTDDWQLTRAVGESLVRCRGFDVHDQAAALVEAYETSTRGWGRSTRLAAAELKTWFDSRGREGRRPGVPVPVEPRRGGGNGVVMKLAPLACWHAVAASEGRALEADVRSLVSLSHSESVSVAVSRVMVGALVRGPGIEPLSSALGSVDGSLEALLRRLFFGADGRARRPSAEEVRETCGTSCDAFSSASLCLATYARHPTSFAEAVREAINAGGDTDTNASITGALVGAHVGLEALLADARAWVDAVPSASEAMSLADRLVDAASGRG